MSDFIHRTDRDSRGHLVRVLSGNSPDYQLSAWIVTNPGSVLDSLDGVDPIYWKVSGDSVDEMTQAEKDSVDAARLAKIDADIEAEVKSRMNMPAPLDVDGVTTSVVASGLVLTVNISPMVVDDTITIVADPDSTTMVKVCYIYDKPTDTLSVEAFVKVTGLYGAISTDEQVVEDFGEWSVTANGDTLVKV